MPMTILGISSLRDKETAALSSQFPPRISRVRPAAISKRFIDGFLTKICNAEQKASSFKGPRCKAGRPANEQAETGKTI